MDKENTASQYRQDLYTLEAKKARFKRVAERRTNRILNDIRLLGNTGNKTLYNYSQPDVDKIFDTIEKKLIETRSRFKSRKSEDVFTLD